MSVNGRRIEVDTTAVSLAISSGKQKEASRIFLNGRQPRVVNAINDMCRFAPAVYIYGHGRNTLTGNSVSVVCTMANHCKASGDDGIDSTNQFN